MSHVTAIQGGVVRVENADAEIESKLSDFALRRDHADGFVIPYGSTTDLVQILTRLRDVGVAFMGSTHGWPPAEVFADLRDKGLISGLFDEVVFTRPGAPRKRSR
jgi:hypothetical protein